MKLGSVNKIILTDLGYSDEHNDLTGIRPYLLVKQKNNDQKVTYKLFVITSQDKQLLSQYEIRQLPTCLKINPSFVNLNLLVYLRTRIGTINVCRKCSLGCLKENEFEFVVKLQKNYSNNKWNARYLQVIEVEK